MLAVYRDDLSGGHLRIICGDCIGVWTRAGFDPPKLAGSLTDLAQELHACENCAVVDRNLAAKPFVSCLRQDAAPVRPPTLTAVGDSLRLGRTRERGPNE